jgi:tRNA pseudouridine38-40 synthase
VNFCLVLEYDGSGFEGWQIQSGDARTVQGCLKDAAERIAGGPAIVRGSGRTDAGVHAEGQVASIEADTDLDPDSLRRALNGVLPPDIAVLRLEAASPDFDPRRQARSKLYRYCLWNGPQRSPLRSRRALYVPQPLGLECMQEAARHLVGRHDFASFQAAGSGVEDTVRSLGRVDVRGEERAEIRLEVEGSGFLRHMVRNIAGTLLEVGLGRREPGDLSALLAARDRTQAGPTAAAHGLTLVRVDYGDMELWEPGSRDCAGAAPRDLHED